MTDRARGLSTRTKLAYGFGAVAYGVKDHGFGYFFLLFYSQVMGVDATLVGLVLLLALAVDAFGDPLIGYFSDNLQSRWGRRHPLMYAAVIPVALGYYFVWNPPADVAGNALFPYMLVMAIIVRTLIALYEIPSSALVAELTLDYNERTSLMSYRHAFGWSGGILFGTFALGFLLVPEGDVTNGMFNIDGYGRMGFYAALVIAASILVCALGTQGQTHVTHRSENSQAQSLGAIYRQLWQTLATRSMAGIMLATVFAALASGLSTGLSFYMSTFFWGFSSQEIGIITVSLLISAGASFLIAPALSLRLGKKQGAFIVGFAAIVLTPATVLLRLLGLMPENGDPLLFPLILLVQVVEVTLVIVFQTLVASMIADLVEANEVKTRRRSEGVFFAATTFARKINQGMGLVLASSILTAIAFPKGAAPEGVPPGVLTQLGIAYIPGVVLPWLLMLLCLSLYSISRAQHEENLRSLGRAGSG